MVTAMLTSRDEDTGPPWLQPLLRTHFFMPCSIHGEASKSECNMFCLDCMEGAFCSYCRVLHKDHRVVQIRRSSYHDVIRVSEIQKLLDLTGVQTYIINSARVVFLNERPQPRPGKGVMNTCEICERSLVDNLRFCSLGCKLQGIKRFEDATFLIASKQQREDSEDSSAHKRARISVRSLERMPGEEAEESTSLDGVTSLSFSHEPNYTTAKCRYGSQASNLSQDMHPHTPPNTPNLRSRGARKRKGIPHRAPMGGCCSQNLLLADWKRFKAQ